MALQLFENNAASSLNGSITNGGTTAVLAAGEGARFPTPTAGDYFLLTLFEHDGSGNEEMFEVVKVTARTADTLTVVRDYEGTVAAAGGPPSGGYAYPTSGGRTVYAELRFTKSAADNFIQSAEIGVAVQAYDADLAWLAANITAAGQAILDDANASAQRTTLGLGDSATKNTGTSAGTVAAGDHTHAGSATPDFITQSFGVL